jgi:hypothetical protein
MTAADRGGYPRFDPRSDSSSWSCDAPSEASSRTAKIAPMSLHSRKQRIDQLCRAVPSAPHTLLGLSPGRPPRPGLAFGASSIRNGSASLAIFTSQWSAPSDSDSLVSSGARKRLRCATKLQPPVRIALEGLGCQLLLPSVRIQRLALGKTLYPSHHHPLK